MSHSNHNPFASFLNADKEAFLRANPALNRSLQHLVMAAAEVVKCSRDPGAKGFFASETKLDKANRQLERCVTEAGPLAMNAVKHLHSNWEQHEALKFALSAFRSRYPQWQDAYALFDALFASLANER
jgi:hypothetical protein